MTGNNVGRLDFSLGSTESVKITCMDNDCVESRDLLAEHGWSALISTPTARVLIDVGQTWQVLSHNSLRLKTNLDEIDSVMITHGHYDHGGSIHGIINSLPSRTEFVASPKIFEQKYSTRRKLRYIGLPRTDSEIEMIQGRFHTSQGPVKLAEGVCTTGAIPRVTTFETPSKYLKVRRKGRLRIDLFEDEQAVLVNVRDLGTILVSGCAHVGIVNTVKHAQNLTGERVWGIVGGLHLRDASDHRIESTIQELKKLNIGLIAPAHCTGFKSSARLYQELPTIYKSVFVGTNLEFK